MKTHRRLFPILVILVCSGDLSEAFAQPPSSRFELGAQFSALRLSDFDATSAGLGGRLSYDLSSWATAEGELNFFPHDDIAVGGSAFTTPDFRIAHRRRRAEAFFGLKLGTRTQRFGAFAKVRPGFARLTHREMECVGPVCPLIALLLVQPVYRTEFALDLGGVLEFYPSSRTVARLDLGDTWVRHRSSAPPCWGADCASHNFASRLGVGFRF